MSLRDEMSADLAAIEADLPGNTFSYTAADATVTEGPFIPTLLNSGLQLIVGGQLSTILQTAIIRADLFAAAPVARRVITLNGTAYRIAEVKLTAPGGSYQLSIISLDE